MDMLKSGDTERWKVRYPVMGSGWSKKVFLGVIVGVLLNAFRVCNNLDMLKCSVEAHTEEFLMMGYGKGWIKHGAALVNLKVLKIVMLYLNSSHHGP